MCDIAGILGRVGAPNERKHLLFGYDTFRELALLLAWEADPKSPFAEEAIRQLCPHLRHYKNPRQFGFMEMYYKSFFRNGGLTEEAGRVLSNAAIRSVGLFDPAYVARLYWLSRHYDLHLHTNHPSRPILD